MSNYEYKIIETMAGSRYVLHCDDKPIGPPLVEVGICFDKELGVLHKHGSPESVQGWRDKTAEKLRDTGTVGEEMVRDLVVLSGPIPLEELNKMLAISGYCTIFVIKTNLQLN